MNDPLHTITYISRSDLGDDAVAIGRQIARLLDSARANNERDGVTGLLMVGRVCLAQILEGPRDVVERTFHRARSDRRHKDIIVLTRATLHARAFGDWSMACVEDESGLLDRFFARRWDDGASGSGGAPLEPMPPRDYLLAEVEHLVGSAGRASTAGLFGTSC